MVRPRRYDAAALTDAAAAQWRVLADAAADVTPAEGAAPSGVGDWSVVELLAHISAGIRAAHRTLSRPAPAGPVGSVSDYLAATAGVAEQVAERSRTLAAGKSVSDLAASLSGESATATAAVRDALARDPHQSVVARLGALPLADWLGTRLVEAAVHSLDLGRALGRPVAVEPAALRPVTQALADLLAVRAPGPAVEVRIPPYAVVQCLAGPRHIRGTPANVVEIGAPADWLLLATGRLSWSAAVAAGAVRASGSRADLAGVLPVMS